MIRYFQYCNIIFMSFFSFFSKSSQKKRPYDSLQYAYNPNQIFAFRTFILESDGMLETKCQYFTINKQTYIDQDLKKILPNVQKTKIRYLKLEIKNPELKISLINEIKHISFINLRSLNLEKCFLQCLQNFKYLNAPELTDLDLRQNYITSIKALRKCHFRLEHLLIENNPLISLEGLPEICMTKQVRRMFLQRFMYNPSIQHPTSIEMFCNVSHLVKCESSQSLSALLGAELPKKLRNAYQLYYLRYRIQIPDNTNEDYIVI